MAGRDLLVRVIVDPSQASRGFRHARNESQQFNRELSRTFRGVAAGSGLFRGLGRSIAFASGGFIAFASAADVLRKSIGAASEQVATQRQLAAQFRASGLSLSRYSDEIEKATHRVSILAGFQDDELTQSFITAFRASKDVSTSLKIQSIAADVARGRHIGLAQSTIALTRAYGGAATSLRRLGIVIPTTLKGMDALNFVAERFRGQARAGTTEQQRFSAALFETEEAIGRALLPEFNNLLRGATKWLSSARNQKRIQRDVTEAVHDFADGMREAVSVVRAISGPLGGLVNTLKILGAAFIGLRLVRLATEIRGIAAAWGLVAASANAAAAAEAKAAAGGAAGAGLGATAARGLGAAVGVGTGIGAAVTAGVVAAHLFPSHRGAINVGSGNDRGSIFRKNGQWFIEYFDTVPGRHRPGGGRSGTFPITPAQAKDLYGITLAAPKAGTSPIGENALGNRPVGPTTPSGGAGTGHLGLRAQFSRLEVQLAQAGITPGTADDRRILQQEAANLRKQLKTRKLSFKDRNELKIQLANVEQQISQIDQQDADAVKRQRKAQHDARKQALETRKATLKEDIASIKQQFKDAVQAARDAIGGLFQGPILNPSESATKHILGVAGPTVSTLTADLNAQVAEGRKRRREISSIVKRAPKGIRAELRKELAGIDIGQLDALAAPGANLQGFFRAFKGREQFATKTARTDLHAQLVRLHADQLQLDQTIHLLVNLDGKKIAEQTTKHQTRHDRNNAKSRRGRNAGRG